MAGGSGTGFVLADQDWRQIIFTAAHVLRAVGWPVIITTSGGFARAVKPWYDDDANSDLAALKLDGTLELEDGSYPRGDAPDEFSATVIPWGDDPADDVHFELDDGSDGMMWNHPGGTDGSWSGAPVIYGNAIVGMNLAHDSALILDRARLKRAWHFFFSARPA